MGVARLEAKLAKFRQFALVACCPVSLDTRQKAEAVGRRTSLRAGQQNGWGGLEVRTTIRSAPKRVRVCSILRDPSVILRTCLSSHRAQYINGSARMLAPISSGDVSVAIEANNATDKN